ncbi:hypothetical protein [Phyllobacterium phragmitis]|uniref:hypothetical protein n=1 Tax=Phyllobacterium phragmitis TaxID=2670329 RepID=UPI0018EDD5BC|nr:hypothetical protein [Phyllobacterium phragmitis]
MVVSGKEHIVSAASLGNVLDGGMGIVPSGLPAHPERTGSKAGVQCGVPDETCLIADKERWSHSRHTIELLMKRDKVKTCQFPV